MTHAGVDGLIPYSGVKVTSSLRLTCGDESVRDGGLGQHALHMAGEKLKGLATAAVRVHQDHDSARTAHLGVHHTWREMSLK